MMKLRGAVAAGLCGGLAAGWYLTCHHRAQPPAPRPAAAPAAGVTCWARGQGVTIKTVGYPGACLWPGKWTGPVDGQPYVAAKPGHHLGPAACTVTASGTTWTVWPSSDLLAALDVCNGDLGSTPPGETP